MDSSVLPPDPASTEIRQHSDSLPPPLASGDAAEQPTVISPRGGLGSSRGGKAFAPYELGKALAGQRLGHFELLEYAGGGGMGAVFRARDTMLNRIVALKVLARDQANDEETLRRFQNEAQSAARLDHDNIARVYYVGEDGGLNYIVFEFIEGENIRELVERRGPLPLSEAVSYTLQIADALAHASSRNVVHRDIKPSNILITDQGRAKLVDMGLARLHQLSREEDDLTASGVTLGTFDYISPEQARDPRGADVRSDIYSLGCTLFYMLTGRPPFPEGTVLQKLLQHNSDAPPDPRQFNPDLAPQISDIVRKMLAKDPRRRYQTPSELISDLLTLADDTDGAALVARGLIVAPPAHTEVSHLARHLPWTVPVGLLLAVVVVLQISPAWRRDGNLPPLSPPAASQVVADVPSPPSPPVLPADNQAVIQPTASTQETVPSAPPPLPSVTAAQGAVVPADVDSIPPAAPAGAPTAAADPAVPPTPAAESTLPVRRGLLWVTDNPTGPHQYTSLRAACSEAKSGDVIELRFNGPRLTRPIALNNVKLTIRPAEGYQPVLLFEPDDFDPAWSPRSMITVAGGRLTLVNMAVELRVPQLVPADGWSMFDLQHCESLDLQRCALTIRNATDSGLPYQSDVAFLAVTAGAGHDAMMDHDDMAGESPASIRLTNCIARGEAALLRMQAMLPAELIWDNGLAVLAEPLLVASGVQMEPRGGRVGLSLRHLTAAVRGEVIRATNGFDAPFSLPIDASCSDSILLTFNRAPLVEHSGIDGLVDLMHTFHWTGERVFYEGFDWNVFWRFTHVDSSNPPRELSFGAWVDHWTDQGEVLWNWGQVAWATLPAPSRLPHSALVSDFLLSQQAEGNAALRAASDGTDAGMDPAALPRWPQSDRQEQPATDAGGAATPSDPPPVVPGG